MPTAEPVRLQGSHIDSIIEIAKDSFPTVWTPTEFAYFVDHACGYCYGTFTDEKLTGYLIALLVQGELDVVSLATSLEQRRHGLARKLLNFAMSDQRIYRVVLEVDVDNAPAIQLYESMGFVTAGLRKAYYDKKRDAYRMELNVRPGSPTYGI